MANFWFLKFSGLFLFLKFLGQFFKFEIFRLVFQNNVLNHKNFKIVVSGNIFAVCGV